MSLAFPIHFAVASPLQYDEEPGARSLAFATELRKTMHSEDMLHVSHSALEESARARSTAWERRLIEENLPYPTKLEEQREVVDAGDKAHKHVHCSERHPEPTLGRVPVPRMAYQSPGCADLNRIDAALNLPNDVFPPCVQRVLAREAACLSYDEVVERVCKCSGAETAKRRVEELAESGALGFDAPHANRADCGTASDTLLVISTDGMGIAMQHDDLRESTKRAAEQSKHKLQTRLTPREKRNRKRMAQVATLYSVQRYPRRAVDIVQREHAVEPPPTLRPRPTNKRVWASVQKDKTVETREAFEDAQRRDPKRERPWVVLVDGEPSQLRAVMVESKEHERAGTMPSVLRTSRFRIQYHATNSGSRWFEATASLCQATPNPSPKPNLGRVN